jgi:predicted nucleotidyltransferase
MEHSKLKRIAFALDDNDIEDLKKILQRASENEATLKESLKNTSLKPIELK